MSKVYTFNDYYYMIADKYDTFDLLAFREYGDETLASLLAEENPNFANVLIFQGGEELRFPELIVTEYAESLPPWRSNETESD